MNDFDDIYPSLESDSKLFQACISRYAISNRDAVGAFEFVDFFS